jgi:predicted RNase H-like HicB family nuclease
MSKYSSKVFWSDEDDAYIAICPEFSDLSAFGDTAEQALAEINIVVDAAIEIYQQEGWPLPEPKILSEHSGQFRVRMPKSLHAKLAAQAEDEGVSLNTLVVTFLSEAVGMSKTRSLVREIVESLLSDTRQMFAQKQIYNIADLRAKRKSYRGQIRHIQ